MSLTLALKSLEKQNLKLEIPSFINRSYVEETLDGSSVLKQFIDEQSGQYCVVTVFKEDQSDIANMDYCYVRFFTTGEKTVHSYDAMENNILDFAIKLSGIADKWFAR